MSKDIESKLNDAIEKIDALARITHDGFMSVDKRFDKVETRLDRIESKLSKTVERYELKDLEHRVEKLEDSPTYHAI